MITRKKLESRIYKELVKVLVLSYVQLFATLMDCSLWIVAPLSMELPGKNTGAGCQPPWESNKITGYDLMVTTIVVTKKSSVVRIWTN